MKKYILIIACLLYFITSINAQDGLVAYYPFSGNANDESLNSNNGTVHGAVLTTDRLGNENKAYYFDGTNDYINCGNDASLNFNEELTISAWIYPESITPGYFTIVQKWRNGTTSTDDVFQFTIRDRDLCCEVATDVNDFYTWTTSTIVEQDVWQHVAYTYDGSSFKIYKNGELQLEHSGVSGNIVESNENLYIGTHNWGSFLLPFHGKLDDIRIYDRSLDDSEILNLYSPASPPSVPISGNFIILIIIMIGITIYIKK